MGNYEQKFLKILQVCQFLNQNNQTDNSFVICGFLLVLT